MLPEITTTHSFQGDYAHASALYSSWCRERHYLHTITHDWFVRAFPHCADPMLSIIGKSGDATYVYEQDSTLVKLWGNGRSMLVQVSASTRGDALAVLNKIIAQYPDDSSDADPNRVPVNFWTRTNNGPSNTRREILVPEWSEVAANYPAGVRSQLDHLMSKYRANPEGGKLILWTGVPGTGKTFALRALAREWRSWCEVHYIIDPDAFFAGSADYLFQVALANRGEDFDFDFDPDDPNPKAKAKPTWRLIVCEDTGELLSSDAKDRTGTGLARFLNMCDGIIGQGLQVQILITTNDDIKTFHPAVTRPGRAASQIKFEAFSRQEAELWAASLSDDYALDRSTYTLAQLFALTRGEDITKTVDTTRSSGFLPIAG